MSSRTTRASHPGQQGRVTQDNKDASSLEQKDTFGNIAFQAREKETKRQESQSFTGLTLLLAVPRAGIEPAHLAVLVFETNASTYSAIWA